MSDARERISAHPELSQLQYHRVAHASALLWTGGPTKLHKRGVEVEPERVQTLLPRANEVLLKRFEAEQWLDELFTTLDQTSFDALLEALVAYFRMIRRGSTSRYQVKAPPLTSNKLPPELDG